MSAGSGRPVLAVDCEKMGRRFGVTAHRTALFGALHEAIIAEGVEIRTSITVSGVSENRTGAYLFHNGELNEKEPWIWLWIRLSEAIKDYASSRRLHLKLFQALSLILTPFYQSDTTFIPALREVLMSTVAKVPPMRSLLSNMVCRTLVDP